METQTPGGFAFLFSVCPNLPATGLGGATTAQPRQLNQHREYLQTVVRGLGHLAFSIRTPARSVKLNLGHKSDRQQTLEGRLQAARADVCLPLANMGHGLPTRLETCALLYRRHSPAHNTGEGGLLGLLHVSPTPPLVFHRATRSWKVGRLSCFMKRCSFGAVAKEMARAPFRLLQYRCGRL